jgi:hypothetical protein
MKTEHSYPGIGALGLPLLEGTVENEVGAPS